MADVFNLAAKLSLDADDYSKELDKAENEGKGFGAKLGSAFGSVASGIGKVTAAVGATATAIAGAAVTGISSLTKSATESYANYEQLIGGVETLFGKSDKAVAEMMKNANNAFKSTGLSANQYMETATSFAASLLQSVGGDADKAAKLTDKAMVDMADNANKMGSSMESIQSAYMGFSKQNYTMLDNLKLGYGGTKAEMERLLADAQKISGVKYDVSSYGDIVEAIHIIQENMGVAGTTAKEADSTISGSLNAVKASWENLLVGMADGSQNMTTLIGNLVDTIVTFAGNLIPRIAEALPRVVTGIVSLITALIPQIPPLLSQLMPAIMEGVTALVEGIITALPVIIELINGMLPDLMTMIGDIATALIGFLLEILPTLIETFITIIPQIAQKIMEMLPTLITSIGELIVDLIPQMITLLVQLITILAQNIGPIIQSIVAVIPKITASFVDGLINNLPALIDGVVQLVVAIIGELPAITMMLIKEIPTIIKSIVGGLVEGIPAILKGIKQIFTAILDSFGGFVGDVVEGAKNLGKKVIGGVKDIFGIHSPSKVFAEIGGYMAEGLGDGWDKEYKGVEAEIEDGLAITTSTAISATSADNASGILNLILSMMEQYFPEFNRKQIVLDSGEVVGALSNKMYDRLNYIDVRATRGIVTI